MIYKCKLCGGQLDINEGDKLTTCPYCGSIQTIPNLEDEKINRLFERGNELIRNCQFDDAINKFEEILSLRNDGPEVYWSLLMAKFGVIYEKDSYTGNMLPTIHRNQDTSIYLDEDYKLTLQYADNTQLDYYNKQAKIIDNIQKKYNTIADREEPFDIFICYKQTDDNTKLDTEDYKIAYDLYNTLTNEGYKAFFSHITLEDKTGEEYEPYIYSALKSSKVLLAIGTKQEYYNAVWVKNEWSRFMYMMRNDHSKHVIPICANTPILPVEFNKYQAIQIQNNVIWQNDLLRSINKLLKTGNNEQINIIDSKINGKKHIVPIILGIIIAAIVCVISFFLIKSHKPNISEAISSSDVGDIVEFGSYEQDNISINGKENIEWIILEKNNSDATLISRYVLDCVSYNTINSYVSYDESYLKLWIEDSFYNEAFDSSEKNRISYIGTMKTDEAKELFEDVSKRSGVASEYAISKGLEISSTFGNCEYWLQPSNELSHYAGKVNANGSINSKPDRLNVGNGFRAFIKIIY